MLGDCGLVALGWVVANGLGGAGGGPGVSRNPIFSDERAGEELELDGRWRDLAIQFATVQSAGGPVPERVSLPGGG